MKPRKYLGDQILSLNIDRIFIDEIQIKTLLLKATSPVCAQCPAAVFETEYVAYTDQNRHAVRCRTWGCSLREGLVQFHRVSDNLRLEPVSEFVIRFPWGLPFARFVLLVQSFMRDSGMESLFRRGDMFLSVYEKESPNTPVCGWKQVDYSHYYALVQDAKSRADQNIFFPPDNPSKAFDSGHHSKSIPYWNRVAAKMSEEEEMRLILEMEAPEDRSAYEAYRNEHALFS